MFSFQHAAHSDIFLIPLIPTLFLDFLDLSSLHSFSFLNVLRSYYCNNWFANKHAILLYIMHVIVHDQVVAMNPTKNVNTACTYEIYMTKDRKMFIAKAKVSRGLTESLNNDQK